LSLEDRTEIQHSLYAGCSFKHIANKIGKDPTTVSKEIKHHVSVQPTEQSLPPCERLRKSPFVCNGCPKQRLKCGHQKQFYYAKPSQVEYKKTLVESREGIPLNKEEFYEMDRIVSDGLGKGQHLYHIVKTNNIKRSLQSIYRDRKKGYLSVNALDFPRIAKFKPRKEKYLPYIPKKTKIGRTFADFTMFCEENEIVHRVEMDTVIGRIGGKVLLTFTFTNSNFIFGRLLDCKSALAVGTAFAELKQTLTSNGFSFGSVFPVLLTDNGGEFANIFAIENDLNGEKECSLFFCDPYQSCQKPRVEKNHTLFRDIAPGGTSFDDWTQETVNLIFSHINSVARAKLHGKTSYELFSFLQSENLCNTFGIKKIAPKAIIQSPKLLRK
jgi:IS30 family transposase